MMTRGYEMGKTGEMWGEEGGEERGD